GARPRPRQGQRQRRRDRARPPARRDRHAPPPDPHPRAPGDAEAPRLRVGLHRRRAGDRDARREVRMSEKRRDVRITGRILFLTEDADLLKRQLYGYEDLDFDPERKLIDNISTDEITPGWVCYYYDETLARYCLVGLRGGHVERAPIRNGGFSVIVSGLSKGCGSSRETAPFSELKAGVQLVIAKTIEKIYGQNAPNIGLLTSTDFGLIERIRRGEAIGIEGFTRGLDPISAAIVEYGGLFPYNRARLKGETTPPIPDTGARPMTLAEKILANRAIRDARTGATGLPAVRPGDALFARTDVRFSHEYV